MNVQHARAYVDRAALKDGEPIPFIAATEGMKDDGIDLRMDRVMLDRYNANPLIGYGHDYWGRESLPIGRSVATTVEVPVLRMLVEFDAGDEFAMTVDRKVRLGYLNAMSIGFSCGRVDAGGVPDWWELYESSIVPLPMDPNATAERIARAMAGLRDGALSAQDLRDLLERAPDPADGPPAPDPQDGPPAEDLARRLRLARARRLATA